MWELVHRGREGHVRPMLEQELWAVDPKVDVSDEGSSRQVLPDKNLVLEFARVYDVVLSLLERDQLQGCLISQVVMIR